jgi:uncharacterized protein HemY
VTESLTDRARDAVILADEAAGHRNSADAARRLDDHERANLYLTRAAKADSRAYAMALFVCDDLAKAVH